MSLVDYLRNDIIGKVNTVEEAEMLVQELAATDWNYWLERREQRRRIEEEILLNEKHLCAGHCERSFPLRELFYLENMNYLCGDCLPVMMDRWGKFCIGCGFFYIPTRSSERKPFCYKCRHGSKEFDRWQQHLGVARKAGLPATLLFPQWLGAIEYFGGKCAYCRKGSIQLLEHFVPVSCQGGTVVENVLPGCYKCNRIKGDKLPEEFCQLFPAENIERIYEYFISLA